MQSPALLTFNPVPAAVFKCALLPALLVISGLIPEAQACRYNIREIGFVDENQPRFELTVFVHGDEQAAWLPPFQNLAQSVFARSNVVWNVADGNGAAALQPLRALLGPRLPGGVLSMPGRDGGWPVYLHAEGDALAAKLKPLVASSARAELTAAAIDTYGAVLLLRGSDAEAGNSARLAARAAIRTTELTLADLPKRISVGPRLIEADAANPDEQVIAWALGVDGKSLTEPVVAVVYGRGRLAGPALNGASITEAAIQAQLSVIGADCECTMDHGWMSAGSIPISFSAADESRLTAALGFDPGHASVKAEVSQILAAQARIASDPNAPRAAGYRETPLEIVTTTPAIASQPPPAVAEETADQQATKWILPGTAAAAAAVIVFVLWRLIMKRGRP